MKECDKIFFGEHGLTSTSANHLANLASECINNLEISLSGEGFVTKTVSNLTNPSKCQEYVLSLGKDEVFIEAVEKQLDEISELKSFIAWIREAIKAKDAEYTRVSRIDIYDYCAYINSLPETKEKLDYPEFIQGQSFSNEDVLKGWSIKDRAEYYSLEATAATIGKYIHQDGWLNKARIKLNKAIGTPATVDNTGSEALIYKIEASVEPFKVDDLFFKLQNKHREISARLNQLKFKIESEAKRLTEESLNEASLRNEEIKTIRNKVSADWMMFKIEESKRVEQLKIVIPNSLQKTFNFLSNLNGK